jgi:5-methylcytosine-specific restriction protein A
MRNTQEWIGKHDDAKVPNYVRLRIFNRDNGICHISGRKITAADTWELEHKIALCNDGEHRESNMAPALTGPHKAKTKYDRAIKSKNDRVQERHLGIKKPRTIRSWRKFDGTIVYAERER